MPGLRLPMSIQASDLAKNVVAGHRVVDAAGKAHPLWCVPVSPTASRWNWSPRCQPCLIGMEACSDAHHGARLFQDHGHTVRLMAQKFVSCGAPARRAKTTRPDAASICGAVTEPSMRFVPIKNVQHQSELLVHGLVTASCISVRHGSTECATRQSSGSDCL
jgi:transposase